MEVRDVDVGLYRRQGLICVPGLWPAEVISGVLEEVESLFTRMLTHQGIPLPGPGPHWEAHLHTALITLFRQFPTSWAAVVSMVPFLPAVQQLGIHPHLLNLLRQVGLDSPCPCTPPIAYFLSEDMAWPGDLHRAPAHQDWRYTQGSVDMVTVWVPLVEVDPSRGSLEWIPGSHRRGLLPTSGHPHLHKVADHALGDIPFQAVHLKPGGVALFSGFTVHRSGINRSGVVRWAVAFRFNNLGDPTFIHRGLPNPYHFIPRTDLVTPGFPSAEDLARIFGRGPAE